MKVSKWGNSLAIRLPTVIVEALKLQAGDDIEIQAIDATTWAIARKPNRGDLLIRLRAFQGRLPADFKFDREEANARSHESPHLN